MWVLNKMLICLTLSQYETFNLCNEEMNICKWSYDEHMQMLLSNTHFRERWTTKIHIAHKCETYNIGHTWRTCVKKKSKVGSKLCLLI